MSNNDIQPPNMDASMPSALSHDASQFKKKTLQIEMEDGSKLNIPKASGRKQFIQMIDVLVSKEENIQKLARGMQTELDNDAFAFYKDILLPLMPKSMLESVDSITPEEQAQAVRDTLAAMDDTMNMNPGGFQSAVEGGMFKDLPPQFDAVLKQNMEHQQNLRREAITKNESESGGVAKDNCIE